MPSGCREYIFTRQKPGYILTSLGPRPKPTPARIASSITRVILEVIRAGVGLGLGPRLYRGVVEEFLKWLMSSGYE